MRHLIRLWLVLLLALLLSSSLIYGQEGRGVLTVANTVGAANSGPFNPITCSNATCRQINALLFPQLFAVDPADGAVVAADGENMGLAAEWSLVEADEQALLTVTLREDAQWSDGTPITAYDVYYSYLATVDETLNREIGRLSHVEAAAPLNERQIAYVLTDYDCDALVQTQYAILPDHLLDAYFEATTTQFFAGIANDSETVTTRHEEYLEATPPDFAYLHDHAFFDAPSVSYGSFRFDALRPTEYIRLSSDDLAYEFVDADRMNLLSQFYTGEIDLLPDPPSRHWADLRANADMQTTTYSNGSTVMLAFNLVRTDRQASYRDRRGEIVEQNAHRTLGDVRVREAISRAIDVDAIIDDALRGEGQRVAGFLSPNSWAYDADAPLLAYEPERAADILREAGWWQISSVRQCMECLHAFPNASLSFELGYVENVPRAALVADQIANQLRRVGINATPRAISINDVLAQRFDVVLWTWPTPYPFVNNYDTFLSPENDVLRTGLNYTSYNNPDVLSLLEEADATADCNLEQRAESLHAAQRLLQEDFAFVWLYMQNEMIAAQANVRNFAPLPNDPFWNLRDWRVWDG